MPWFEHGAVRIYYEEAGVGEPVPLLPGFAGNIGQLSALRETLGSGNRVIAADLPGSGRSGPQPRAYTATYYAEDARAFAALLDHLETGPAHLLGFSDGGEVALLMAALTPGVARSVATWGAAGTLTQVPRPMLDAMADVIDQPIPPMQQFRDYLIAAYGEANARATTRNFVGALRAIIAEGGDISWSKAGDIACPVLLITGEHDTFAPPQVVAELATRIGGAAFLEAAGAGHGVHDDRPDWLAQTILDWLRRAAP